jgi:hypothetical protein
MTTERPNDAAIAVLQVEQKNISAKVESVSDAISRHVTECARLQKWVLGTLLFLAGWLVAHSPEAAKVFTKLLEAL